MVMKAELEPDVAIDTVPLAKPCVNGREEELVLEVLRSGQLSLGPMLARFEQQFAKTIGVKHAVACSSGTAGLHVACLTAGFGPGDEVITSPYSFVASANVIRYCGAKVVFADIDRNSLNVDPAAVRAAVTENTRGLLPVHIFGYPADLNPLQEIATAHDLAIVEDACEALGATYDGKTVGTHGNPAVFAFYANKQMTTGEGGIIVTDDDDLADQWRSLINQGRADTGQWLAHDRLGYNYRLSDIASALGVAQLEKLAWMLSMREQLAREYDRLFASIDGVSTPWRGPDTRSWFVYWLLLDERFNRNEVMAQLGERGIQAKPYLPCIHTQPCYKELGFEEGMFPVAESVSRQSIALPFFPEMSPGAQQRVVDTVAEVLAAN